MFIFRKAFSILPVCSILLSPLISGCGQLTDKPNDSAPTVARQAIDQSNDSITRRAAKPGVASPGTPTSDVQNLPGGIGQYRTYTNGVIVYTNDNGAVLLSQAIFDKWLSLQGQVALDDGSDLYLFLGLPQADSTTVGSSTQAQFDRGLIEIDSAGSHVTYGAIYTRYTALAATLGLPRSDEAAEGTGGIFQVFENGELHYRAGLVEAPGVWGPVLTRWKALGGATGSLGFPKGDTATVNTSSGTQIGQKGVFENGSIYYQTGAASAYEIYATTGDLLASYEHKYGGPAGWLGFPIGAQGVADAGDSYVDFQNGILVYHLQPAGSTPAGYTLAFGNMLFKYDHVFGYGGDCECLPLVGCICGSQDVYTYLNLSTNSGTILNGWRYPDSGDCGDDCTVNGQWSVGVANSKLTVSAWLQAWDADDTSSDDQLGTVAATYNINNLWGYYDTHDHANAYDSDDSMMATFYVTRDTYPYDSSDFRGEMWWSFHNFSTPELSYDQYALTFTDVDPDETWWHPLNKLFYKWVYKGYAAGGNCFGMSLECIYAQEGKSAYAEPIHDWFPEHAGNDLTDPPQTGGVTSLENVINVKQGYSIGLNTVLWFLANGLGNLQFRATPDPNQNWAASYALYQAGEYSVINMYETWYFGGGHTIRPYSWDPNIGGPPCGGTLTGPCQYIHIADPNYPSPKYTNDDMLIFDPGDFFTYNHEPTKFNGGAFTGSHMEYIPYRLLHEDQVTPLAVFSNPIELINDGLSIFSRQ